MSLEYKITVTSDDVNESIPKNSSHCMIATAIQNEIPKSKYVSIDIQTIRFTVDHIRYIYLTPRVCQRAILDFDEGKKPNGFTFKLSNPHTINKQKNEEPRLVRHKSRKPRIVGGKEPPRHKGTRREFGIRAFI